MSKWINADSLEWMKNSTEEFDFVLADPPYETFPLINDSIDLALERCRGPVAYFMYAEDLALLRRQPERVCFWVKPISTKNTSRTYSRFVEVLAFYNLNNSPFNQNLQWANRSGVFTDQLLHKQCHPFEKPESLIERLLLTHLRPGESVLDPFAGSGTVGKVAERLGFEHTSIELEAKWTVLWPRVDNVSCR